jgi:hypothetical protein
LLLRLLVLLLRLLLVHLLSPFPSLIIHTWAISFITFARLEYILAIFNHFEGAFLGYAFSTRGIIF